MHQDRLASHLRGVRDKQVEKKEKGLIENLRTKKD